MNNTGAIVQLNNYQQYDYILTSNPEITFFNVVYRKYTNFGKIAIENLIDTPISFDKSCSIKIQKQHDLLSNLTMKIKLPVFDLTTLNKELSAKYQKTNISEYEQNYTYFIDFKRRLQYNVNYFFDNTNIDYTTYVTDLNTYILTMFVDTDFFAFFDIVDFFLPGLKNSSYYKNASLYSIVNSVLYYNYETSQLDITLFEIVIKKNMSVLNDFDKICYDIIKSISLKTYVKIDWINKIAIYLFNYFEFFVGSNSIVKLSAEYIDSHGSLKYMSPKLYNSLINGETCYLPLPFWFCEQYSSAFPLVSLQYSDVFLKFKIKNYTELLNITVSDELTINDLINDYNLIELIEEQLSTFNILLITEYIALDSFERQKFIQSGHEYLINEINEITYTHVNQFNNDLTLNFYHCIRDLRWFVSPEIKTTNTYFIPYPVNNHYYTINYNYASNDVYYNMYLKSFNYEHINNSYITFQIETIVEKLWIDNIINQSVISTDYDSLIDNKKYLYCISSSLYLNSYLLFNTSYEFFNYLQPYNYYNSTPFLGTNIYSFSLYPLEIAPSGSFNIGRISNVLMKLQLQNFNNNDDTFKIKVIVTTINVLRVIGGICNKAYRY